MREVEIPIGRDQMAKVAVAQVSVSEPLGSVVWYSVSEQVIPHEKLEQMLAAEGVPQEFWPKRTRPSSAFKRAVRDVQSENHVSMKGREYYVDYEYVEDPVTKQSQKISDTMVIVRRTLDSAKDAMPVVASARFDKARNSVEFRQRQAFEPRDNGIEPYIMHWFDVYSKSFAADDVRGMISDALYRSFRMPLRESGGIFFVPKPNMGPIEAVARVVEKLPGSEMMALPVIDRESERATLLKRYEKATLERLDEVFGQVKEIIDRKEQVVPSVFDRFVEELKYLAEQKTEYEQLLSVTMGKVQIQMDALHTYVTLMAPLVKKKD